MKQIILLISIFNILNNSFCCDKLNLINKSTITGVKYLKKLSIDTTNQKFEWTNLITTECKYGINTYSFSATYYRYRIIPSKKFIIPAFIGIEFTTLQNSYLKNELYKKINGWSYSPGICGFRKVKNNLYFNFLIRVSMGEEELINLNDIKTKSDFYGALISQGIYYISPKKYGIITGLSFYELYTTSKVYNYDIGLKFEFGFKF